MSFDPNSKLVNYACYTAYFVDYGVREQPVAGPAGTPMDVVRVHGGRCMKFVNFVCQSYDTTPTPPDPINPNAPDEILKMKSVSAPFKYEMPDGTIVNTVAGVYIYICPVPPSDTDNINIGAPPYDGALQTILMPSDFVKNLLSGITPSSSGPWGGLTGGNPYPPGYSG